MINDKKEIFSYIIIFTLIIGIYFSINKYDVYNKFEEIKNSCYNPLINNQTKWNIPSSKEANDFCVNKGFNSGWLSQTCNANEIQCFKNFGELSQYKCVGVQ